MEFNSNLNNNCRSALEKFSKKYLLDKNTLGIVLSGSYVHSKPDKNSDLDVFIVLGKGKNRERGNLFIEGVEIEYFVNPLRQVEEYFKEEASKKKANPTTAHMFANCVVLYKKGKSLDKLIKKAKAIVSKSREKPSKIEIENMKYHIDDMRKDLEDVFLRKDVFAFQIIHKQVLEKALEIFFSIKRIHQEKSKRLESQLKVLDPIFERIFSNALLEKDLAKNFELTNNLIAYTEKLLGGRRPNTWVLKSKCSFGIK